MLRSPPSLLHSYAITGTSRSNQLLLSSLSSASLYRSHVSIPPANPTRFLSLHLAKYTFRCSAAVEKDRVEVEGVECREELNVSVEIGSPRITNGVRWFKMSSGDQAFLLFTFVACTLSVAFTSLVVATIPTLRAMRKTALSLAKLVDTAREELPSTMAAVRLSGMEISDLTLELSELSQEIADGVTRSAQAVQAAEAGIRQIGTLARQKTMSMIEERANLPNISLQPVVAGAARKTSRVVGQARKTLMNIISGGESDSESHDRADY